MRSSSGTGGCANNGSTGSFWYNNNNNNCHRHHHKNRHFAELTALATLILVYTLVTVVTYSKVSETETSSTGSTSGAFLLTAAAGAPTTPGAVVTPGGGGPRLRDVTAVATDAVADGIHEIQHLFPIHVGSDTEVIRHPGLALVDPAKIPSGLPTTLTVPKFFDESHGAYYFGKVPGVNHTVRHFLGDGETLLTPELASQIGSWIPYTLDNGTVVDRMETIYCSIASYRDPECTGTVEDLYARARYPARIRVAILDQRVDGDARCSTPAQPCDTHPAQALCRYRHLIDTYEMDARLAVGPVFARHVAHRHYRGEYFAMQIDSHVRFVEHWDADVVGQWVSAHNEMAVLSTYLSDIIGSIDPVTHAGIHPGRPIMCQSDYEGQGAGKHLRHGQQPEGVAGIVGQPTLHPFWAAGFSFARGHFVVQVPYDQHLPMVFQGEEISIGLRGFTYGYDYYAAERSTCFHMYAIKENLEKRKKVPLFWENSGIYQGTGSSAMKRLNTIIGMEHYPVDEWLQEDLHRYGLGHVRNVKKFFRVFGIHTQNQTVEAHLCQFVGKPMMRVFLPALRENHMGIDYDKINYEFKDPSPEKVKIKAKF